MEAAVKQLVRSMGLPEHLGPERSAKGILEDWPRLTWLLAFGLGGQRSALHTSAGKLRVGEAWRSHGNGRIGRDSVWAAAPALDDGAGPKVLLYGDVVPAMGSRSGPLICRNLTPAPLLALLLLCHRLTWQRGVGQVAGWINVSAPFEDLSLLGAAGEAHLQLLEAFCCERRQQGSSEQRSHRLAWGELLRTLAAGGHSVRPGPSNLSANAGEIVSWELESVYCPPSP